MSAETLSHTRPTAPVSQSCPSWCEVTAFESHDTTEGDSCFSPATSLMLSLEAPDEHGEPETLDVNTSRTESGNEIRIDKSEASALQMTFQEARTLLAGIEAAIAFAEQP